MLDRSPSSPKNPNEQQPVATTVEAKPVAANDAANAAPAVTASNPAVSSEAAPSVSPANPSVSSAVSAAEVKEEITIEISDLPGDFCLHSMDGDRTYINLMLYFSREDSYAYALSSLINPQLGEVFIGNKVEKAIEVAKRENMIPQDKHVHGRFFLAKEVDVRTVAEQPVVEQPAEDKANSPRPGQA